MEDLSFTKFLAYYLIFFLTPLGILMNQLRSIEKQNRRTADALERVANSLEAKPLKFEDVVGSN